MKKGDEVYVVDDKDGRAYKCIVKKAEEQRIFIHWHRWNKRFDRWINLDDERLLSRNAANGISVCESVPVGPENQSSRSDEERYIDEVYDSLQQPQVESGANGGGSKRTRDSHSDGSGDENTPKRALLHSSASSADTSTSSAGESSSTPRNSTMRIQVDNQSDPTTLEREMPLHTAASLAVAQSSGGAALGGEPPLANAEVELSEREGGSSPVIGPSQRAETTAQHSTIDPSQRPLSVQVVADSEVRPQVDVVGAVRHCSLCCGNIIDVNVSCGACGALSC